MLKWILLGGVSHSLHWIPDNPRSYVRTSDGCAWNGADRVVQLRSYLDGGGEGMKRLQRFWLWWNNAPPGQIVRAAILVTGINIAILVVHLLVMW